MANTATFLKTDNDKEAVSDLVKGAGMRVLVGKDMAFRPGLGSPPRLYTVLRFDRARDAYFIRDKSTLVEFPHSVSLRELSIGEKSRTARDPLIRALIDNGFDAGPWLMDGQQLIRDPPVSSPSV
jgi:hypothetical protein